MEPFKEVTGKVPGYTQNRILHVGPRTKDKFRFGKYKGQYVLKSLKKDEVYKEWCLKNVEGFGLYLMEIEQKQNK